MAIEENNRIITHGDGINIAAGLDAIVAAILSSSSSSELTMEKIKELTRFGVAPKVIKIGDELTFSESPSLSTIIAGNTVDGVTSGVTSETIDLNTFVTKVGTTSNVIVQFYYYSGAWHIDSITGTVISLSDYGLTITGTPKNNDYITVALAATDFTMQVADFDHYTMKNSDIKHHIVLATKQCIRNAQQFESNPELSFANSLAILPAGKYKFTCYKADDGQTAVYDGIYVFTTTKDIPLGGGFIHSKIGANISWGGGTSTDPTSGTISTYAADHATTIETGLVVTSYNSTTDTDAVDLGTMSSEYFTGCTYKSSFGYMNFTRRVRYGSGDWASSIYRQ
jgi:hypothetical protein